MESLRNRNFQRDLRTEKSESRRFASICAASINQSIILACTPGLWRDLYMSVVLRRFSLGLYLITIILSIYSLLYVRSFCSGHIFYRLFLLAWDILIASPLSFFRVQRFSVGTLDRCSLYFRNSSMYCSTVSFPCPHSQYGEV